MSSEINTIVFDAYVYEFYGMTLYDCVDTWLKEHPEATTTVEDGAVTTPKVADKAITLAKFADDIVDATLTQTGHPADAKATGDAIAADRTRLTAVEGEADALDARITSLATLTEGSTTGDAELMDARTVGGTTYASLHQAIDTEFTNVKSDLYDVTGLLLPAWEIGAIDGTTGGNTSSTKRVRTSGYLPNNVKVFIKSGFKVRVNFYDSNHTFMTQGVWHDEKFDAYNANASYIRLMGGYTDDSAITASDIASAIGYIALHEVENTLADMKGRLAEALLYNGEVSGTTFFENTLNGFYNFTKAQLDDLTDKPENLANGGILFVTYPSASNTRFQIILSTTGGMWFRYGSNDFEQIIGAGGDSGHDTDTVWYALGDSLTQGFYSADGEIAGVTSKGYPYWASQYNGYTFTNYGVGGSGYIHDATVGDGLNARAKVDTIDFSGCDLVTLAFGVNDWHYNQVIGTVDDLVSAGDSMASNMKYCIEKIMNDNPLCKIVVILPMNCSKYGGTFETDWGLGTSLETSGTLQHVIDVEKAICEYYGIQYIEQSEVGVVNRLNITDVLPDGIHPAIELYKQMGKNIAKQIEFV